MTNSKLPPADDSDLVTVSESMAAKAARKDLATAAASASSRVIPGKISNPTK
jgi:hypothetical protein